MRVWVIALVCGLVYATPANADESGAANLCLTANQAEEVSAAERRRRAKLRRKIKKLKKKAKRNKRHYKKNKRHYKKKRGKRGASGGKCVWWNYPRIKACGLVFAGTRTCGKGPLKAANKVCRRLAKRGGPCRCGSR